MQEQLDIQGRIALYEIPDWTDAELRYWWEPETEQGPDGIWRIVRPARMSVGEKGSRLILEAKNLLTNVGMAQILNNLSVTGQGSMQAFAQIFSVGNGTVSGVTRSDSSVAGDGFTTGARKVPASFSIVGFTTTITTNFGSGDGVGTWTNAGYYGFKPSGSQNATTSSGTGQLNSHVLFGYTKGASSIAATYTFTLSN